MSALTGTVHRKRIDRADAQLDTPTGPTSRGFLEQEPDPDATARVRIGGEVVGPIPIVETTTPAAAGDEVFVHFDSADRALYAIARPTSR